MPYTAAILDRFTTDHTSSLQQQVGQCTECLSLLLAQYELLAEMLNKHKLPQEEVEGVIQQYNDVSQAITQQHFTSFFFFTHSCSYNKSQMRETAQSYSRHRSSDTRSHLHNSYYVHQKCIHTYICTCVCTYVGIHTYAHEPLKMCTCMVLYKYILYYAVNVFEFI